MTQNGGPSVKIPLRRLDNRIGQTLDEIGDYVVEYGADEDSGAWYRLWKSGWLEQGGDATSNVEFTFVKPFVSVPTITGVLVNSESNYSHTWRCQTVSNTSAKFVGAYNNTIYAYRFKWYACGYSA